MNSSVIALKAWAITRLQIFHEQLIRNSPTNHVITSTNLIHL